MTPKELHEKAAKIVSTHAKMSHVTPADVSRSVSVAFQVISSLPSDEALLLLSKLNTLGGKARTKAREAKKIAGAKPKKKSAAKKK